MSKNGRAPIVRGRSLPGDSRQMRWWSVTGVVVLVVANVVLVGLLLDRPAPVGDLTSNPDLVAELEAEPQRSPTPEPTPTPTAEPPEPIETVAPQYVLAALSADVAWRATTGACPDATATPQLTTDGGATWQTSDATSLTGITAVQRILTSSSSQATFIGFNVDNCAPTVSRTFVGGDDYATYDNELDAFWWVPADVSQVHSPQLGISAAPCSTVRTIAVVSNSVAAVLCGDGTVHATSDSAATFTAIATILGAQAVVPVENGYLVASLGDVECDGVSITTIDSASASAQAVGCLLTNDAPDELVGRVALGLGGGTLWAWAGDQLGRSADFGATWL